MFDIKILNLTKKKKKKKSLIQTKFQILEEKHLKIVINLTGLVLWTNA